jgi:hypothetical protein
MERALLAYPKLSGGLIFCLGRELPYEKNQCIVEKAIKYSARGVVWTVQGHILQNSSLIGIKDYLPMHTE